MKKVDISELYVDLVNYIDFDLMWVVEGRICPAIHHNILVPIRNALYSTYELDI